MLRRRTLRLVTESMVKQAVELSLPTIRMLCARYTWGPKGVVIAVSCQSLAKPYVYVMEELGPRETWKDDGKDIDFKTIALQKLAVSSRTSHTSHDILHNKPWLLREGDSLYQGGVAEDDGLAVAASGSYSEIDETIAWIVFNVIAGLCHMKLRKLNSLGVHAL